MLYLRTLVFYLQLNLDHSPANSEEIVTLLFWFFGCINIFITPFFYKSIAPPSSKIRIEIIFTILAVASFVFIILGNYYFYLSGLLLSSGYILYVLIRLTIREKQITRPFPPKAALIITGCFAPFLFIDMLEAVPLIRSVFPSWFFYTDSFPVYSIAIIILFVFFNIKKERTAVPPDRNIASFFHLKEHYGITQREYEILKLMLEGKNNMQLTSLLFISPSTVKKHINSLYKKLKTGSRWELIHLSDLFS